MRAAIFILAVLLASACLAADPPPQLFTDGQPVRVESNSLGYAVTKPDGTWVQWLRGPDGSLTLGRARIRQFADGSWRSNDGRTFRKTAYGYAGRTTNGRAVAVYVGARSVGVGGATWLRGARGFYRSRVN